MSSATRDRLWGHEARLFSDGAAPAKVELTASRTTPSGTAIAVDAFAGRRGYGSYALDAGSENG